MKLNFWKVFTAIVFIGSIPLTVLYVFFSGNKQFGWIGNLSLAIIALLGLIGGVRGFIIYGVQRRPGPFSNYLRPRQTFSKNKRYLLIISSSTTCLAMVFFAHGILFLVNGGGDIQANTGASFLIPKPGEYTLWASSDNLNDTNISTLANQIQIAHDQDKKVVQKQPMLMQAVYRRNGEEFLAICNFQFPTPGSYNLLTSEKAMAEKIILHRSASLGLMVLTLLCFFVGACSMLFSVFLVWSGRIVSPKMHD